MDTLSFIKAVAPGAVETMKKYRVLASVSIAQAAVESGWGAHAPGNNLFGIKAGSGWKGETQVLTTQEEVSGKLVTVKDTFRAYDSWADSIEDHGLFLYSNKRYGNILGVTDYKLVCQRLKADGYATNSNYPSLLTGIIEKYKLTSYDSGTSSGTVPSNTAKSGVYSVSGFPNAVTAVAATVISVLNSDGSAASGHYVSKGDKLCIVGLDYDRQLLEVVYPAGSGYLHGYIKNTQGSVTKSYFFKWKNGSTPETVYSAATGSNSIGTIYAQEIATPLYESNGRYAILYNTVKGNETKFGYVTYHGGFEFPSSGTPAAGATGKDVYGVSGYPYPANAKAKADFEVCDSKGTAAPGRKVTSGDKICIVSVDYDRQLAEIVYPTSSGYMHGYIKNLQSKISDTWHFKWRNGSTAETVYGASTGSSAVGTISPGEKATPLFQKNGRYALLYNTAKGQETKFGFVKYHDGFSF